MEIHQKIKTEEFKGDKQTTLQVLFISSGKHRYIQIYFGIYPELFSILTSEHKVGKIKRSKSGHNLHIYYSG